jgi:hypothetical protein
LPQLKLELEQLAASIEQIDAVIQQAATNSITHESHFVVDLKTGDSLLPTLVSMDGKPIRRSGCHICGVFTDLNSVGSSVLYTQFHSTFSP